MRKKIRIRYFYTYAQNKFNFLSLYHCPAKVCDKLNFYNNKNELERWGWKWWFWFSSCLIHFDFVVVFVFLCGESSIDSKRKRKDKIWLMKWLWQRHTNTYATDENIVFACIRYHWYPPICSLTCEKSFCRTRARKNLFSHATELLSHAVGHSSWINRKLVVNKNLADMLKR